MEEPVLQQGFCPSSISEDPGDRLRRDMGRWEGGLPRKAWAVGQAGARLGH